MRFEVTYYYWVVSSLAVSGCTGHQVGVHGSMFEERQLLRILALMTIISMNSIIIRY